MHAATVLVLHANPLFARSLHDCVRATYPGVTCLAASGTADAASVLSTSPVDVFLTSLDAGEEDVVDMLLHLARRAQSLARTLVMTDQPGVRLLLTLWRLGVGGVFNLRDERPECLGAALSAMASGQKYWSQCFAAALMSNEARIVSHQLTSAEQLALALLGDGCCDKTAAERIGMSLNAVRSLRKELYGKLQVHDKEGLQRTAARLSFTRVAVDGTRPRGAATLIVEYVEHSKRPVKLPASTLARFGFATETNPLGSKPPFKKPV